MNIKHIIFDLDGTLIDSAPAILAGFEAAFSACGRAPKVPVTPSVIGPPLMETLAVLTGTTEPGVLNSLAEAFKEHYDHSGYRQTKVFPGVDQLLRVLHERGKTLYVATNKRILPTTRIINLLGWDSYFDHVYTLDSYQPAITTKSTLLIRILADKQLNTETAIYIGDRDEDGIAATDAGMPFLLVTWGYGGLWNDRWTKIYRPSTLLGMV